MNELIVMKSSSGELVTNSLVIAEGAEVEHKNVIQMARTYLPDLEEFGGVEFKILPFETSGGTQNRTVAILNESQAIMIISYMRNNEIVRRFKIALIKCFMEMRRALAEPSFNVPTSLSGALRLAAEQAEIIETQAKQLEEAKPHIAFVEQYVDSTGSKGFRQVCKLLKAKENEFREFLLSKKIMYRLGSEWTAYQCHIDAGRFDVKAGTSTESKHAFNQTRFTPKGITWIVGEWARYKLAQDIERKAA